MRNRIIIVIMVILILIFLINPVRYFLYDEDINEIPDHLDYHRAINDSLTSRIQEEAAKHNCRNIIRPVIKVKDQPASLPSLMEDVNLAIASYENWCLSVDDEMRQKMIRRQEEYINKWGDKIGGEGMKEILEQKHQISKSIDYTAEALITRIKKDQVDDLELVLKIFSEEQESLVFDVKLPFSNPATIEKMQSEIDQQINALDEMQKKSRNGLYAAGSLCVLLVVFLLVSFIVSYRKKLKEDKERDYLKNQILMRQELVDNGHFVAALELADRYLLHFPNDIEIMAFRERLLDVTNNDPKKAQVAFVEAKKLKLRLENRGQGNYLTPEEKETLSALLPYYPELENSYTKMIGYEEEDRLRAEFDNRYNELVEMMHLKKWTQAGQEVKLLKKTYPDKEQIIDLENEIEDKIRQSDKKLIEIRASLGNENISEIYTMLDEFLTCHVDHPPAIDFKSKIEKARIKEAVLLEDENGDQLPIFCKSEVILGREDEHVSVDIAINSKYISRPHLKIELIGDKLYLEDLNSSGGSYQAGEKFSRTEITNSQTITLAKVIDLNICLQKDNNNINCVYMECEGIKWIILNKAINFNLTKNKLDLSGTDNIFKLQDQVIIVQSDGDREILQPEGKVILSGFEYKVSFI